MPEAVIEWSRVAAERIPGAQGVAEVRVRQVGQVRVRLVDYGPGYLADHWCSKGHVIHLIAGTLEIEHEDGTPAVRLASGMSWYVADGEGSAHRVRSQMGARVFIVD